MKQKVLVIEDDVQLNIVISEFFKIKGFEVFNAYDGIEAINLIDTIKKFDISLFVIDINLPTYSGLDILQYIREENCNVPIIIITASLDIENLANAFDKGCSEYIKKPFHIKELEVRVKHLLKNETNNIYFSSDFLYDTMAKDFYFKNEKIVLRNKEKRLIDILIQNINKLVPNEIVFDYVWDGENRETYPIRQLLADVRKKLPLDIIKTIVKQGYIIEVKNEK